MTQIICTLHFTILQLCFPLQIAYLSSIGGRDLVDTTSRVMSGILENALAMKFNLRGKGEKRAFAQLALFRIVISKLKKPTKLLTVLLCRYFYFR